MRTLCALSLLIILILAAVPVSAQPAPQGRTPTPTPPVPVDVIDACRDAVDGIDALHAGLGWPDHLMQENAARESGDFDVSAYFTVLDHLAMDDGTALDYVYLYEFMGGYPVLYARPEAQPPFATFASFRARYGDNRAKWPDYRDAVRVDDTPEGYMQFAVLGVMGRQFYLHWHANYNDLRLVCDQDALDGLLSLIEFGQRLPDEVQAAARALDPTPTVELDEDTARVAVTAFTKWGGFYRFTFTINREFPHVILTESESLVPYDCGIMF